MRAADTNILVRIVVRDNVAEARSADEFISKGAWVSHVVMAETCWVLGSVYGFRPGAIATAVDMLLSHQHLVFQESDAVSAALAMFKHHPSVGFADCLILELARRNGHTPLGTLDRKLGRLDGAQRL